MSPQCCLGLRTEVFASSSTAVDEVLFLDDAKVLKSNRGGHGMPAECVDMPKVTQGLLPFELGEYVCLHESSGQGHVPARNTLGEGVDVSLAVPMVPTEH